MRSNYKRYSSFDAEDRIVRFQKDAVLEHRLDLLNDSLAPFEESLTLGVGGTAAPPIIITGVPRSGTTFLYQLLASRLRVGYVSNLMARFYGAPLTGAFLHKTLIRDEMRELSVFRSTHGNTHHIFEPHEFGYFWLRYLPCRDDCHEPAPETACGKLGFEAMNAKLNLISQVFELPVVYKCMVAPFFLKPFFEKTQAFILHLVRDRAQTMRSILNVREERLGSRHKWWSIRPQGWNDRLHLGPEEQVAWQYDTVYERICSDGREHRDRYVELSYETLCEIEMSAMEEFIERYERFTNVTLEARCTSKAE